MNGKDGGSRRALAMIRVLAAMDQIPRLEILRGFVAHVFPSERAKEVRWSKLGLPWLLKITVRALLKIAMRALPEPLFRRLLPMIPRMPGTRYVYPLPDHAGLRRLLDAPMRADLKSVLGHFYKIEIGAMLAGCSINKRTPTAEETAAFLARFPFEVDD